MSELKPCPFCGGKAVVDKHRFYNDKTKGFTDSSFGVKCYECFAQSYQFYTTEEKAIEAWNRRVHNSNDFTPQKDDFSKEGGQ